MGLGNYMNVLRELVQRVRKFMLSVVDSEPCESSALPTEHIKSLGVMVLRSERLDISRAFQAGTDRCVLPNFTARGDSARFRAYLRISAATTRVAYCRLVFGTHILAIARGAWKGVPRERRLCRFCEEYVETEAHALLGCGECEGAMGTDDAERMNLHRRRFWDELGEVHSKTDVKAREELRERGCRAALEVLLARGDTDVAVATLIGILAVRIFAEFAKVPMYEE